MKRDRFEVEIRASENEEWRVDEFNKLENNLRKIKHLGLGVEPRLVFKETDNVDIFPFLELLKKSNVSLSLKVEVLDDSGEVCLIAVYNKLYITSCYVNLSYDTSKSLTWVCDCWMNPLDSNLSISKKTL